MYAFVLTTLPSLASTSFVSIGYCHPPFSTHRRRPNARTNIVRHPYHISPAWQQQKPSEETSSRPSQSTTYIQCNAAPPPTGGAYLTPEALERAKTGNVFEKMKLNKCGSAMWTEVHQLQKILREGTTDFKDLEEDDLDHRLKWAGLFHRRKRTPGKFMMRLKVPNGILNSNQMRYFVHALEKYAPQGTDVDGHTYQAACIDITTRMNIQLRGVELADAGDIVDGLFQVGLTSFMSGMDNVRNLVGSPLAGIDPFELVDTRQLCYDLNDMITNHRKGRPDLANLPRKFNIAVSGSRDDFAHTHINDIGLVPIANPQRGGEIGFNVYVGGFFSIKRNEEALPLNVWLPQADVVPFCESALLYYRDHGDRKNRQSIRLMYMLDQWGLDGFRNGVAEYMRRRNEGLEEFQFLPAVVPSGPEYATAWKRRDVTGVHPQKQQGLCWVSACVPAGRLSLQDMLDLAAVADKYSGGEMRLTVEQNILFPNVRIGSQGDADIPAGGSYSSHGSRIHDETSVSTSSSSGTVQEMLQEPIFGKFRVRPGVMSGGLVSCTGSEFCGLALIETKNRAIMVSEMLDATMELSQPVRMHWTGCKNSCGQVQVADIGLMGGPARNAAGKAVEGVDIYVGGQIGEGARLGKMVAKGVPCDDLDILVGRLQDIMVEHFGGKKRDLASSSLVDAPSTTSVSSLAAGKTENSLQ